MEILWLGELVIDDQLQSLRQRVIKQIEIIHLVEQIPQNDTKEWVVSGIKSDIALGKFFLIIINVPEQLFHVGDFLLVKHLFNSIVIFKGLEIGWLLR